MCHDFPVGNLLRISIGFPFDFLAGKLKNTGSEFCRCEIYAGFFFTKTQTHFKYKNILEWLLMKIPGNQPIFCLWPIQKHLHFRNSR